VPHSYHCYLPPYIEQSTTHSIVDETVVSTDSRSLCRCSTSDQQEIDGKIGFLIDARRMAFSIQLHVHLSLEFLTRSFPQSTTMFFSVTYADLLTMPNTDDVTARCLATYTIHRSLCQDHICKRTLRSLSFTSSLSFFSSCQLANLHLPLLH
jgi:hypothetical protein